MSLCSYLGATDHILLTKPGEPTAGDYTWTAGAALELPIADDVKPRPETIESERMRGQWDAAEADMEQGSVPVNGDLVLDMGRSELIRWLPAMLMTTDSGGDVYASGVNFGATSKMGLLQRRGTTDLEIQEAMVRQWQMQVNAGRSAQFTLGLIARLAKAKTIDSAWVTTAAAAAPTAAGARVMMAKEATLTVDSVDIPWDTFTLTCNNQLEAAFRGSEYANCVDANDIRAITLEGQLPFNATTEALLAKSYQELSASIVFAAADGTQADFVFGALTWNGQPPSFRGRGKQLLPVSFRAVKSAAGAAALTVTVDDTPT